MKRDEKKIGIMPKSEKLGNSKIKKPINVPNIIINYIRKEVIPPSIVLRRNIIIHYISKKVIPPSIVLRRKV